MDTAAHPVDAPAAALDPRWVRRAALGVATRPWLWATALRQLVLLAEPGWWRSAQRLPLPDAAYLRFRLQTAYGDAGRAPAPGDVVTYLHWCRAWPRVTR